MRTYRWDRHAIKAEVHRRGLTLLGIAQAAGLEPSACKVALRRRNYRGEAAIAAALGIDPSVLWPDRYRRPVSSGRNPSRIQPRTASPNAASPLTLRGGE
ncbi:helix-turn-helix domain-containing protein [Xanthobacteraceae bacterium Astr-EGSB]|uniref:helix-turn-helix domain-containing protein n=1 Tax=Astrobacterium formosum TaxID=3069710 RepID=UPI0027B5DA74|nr:helix-turn-helix domain-containing protein [Xanthobacteraceae bacterium Astr-EGSB]